MLSPKVLLVFLVLVAYTQGGTENKCSGDGIDLCAVLNSLDTFEINIKVLNLITKLQNIVGSVISSTVCAIDVHVCLPVCSIVQALLDLDIELNVINSLIVSIRNEPPECNV